MEEILIKNLLKDIEEYKGDALNTVLRHALSETSIAYVVSNADNIRDMNFSFDIDIRTMSATNQKSSGRCWIFAACNIVREIIAQKLNVSNFEISQSFLAFYDRLEKVNYTLEAIIELINKPLDDRTVMFINQQGIGDGGQWDMFVSLVEKYGIVPKAVVPETYTSSSTNESNKLINFNIRKFAAEARIIFEKKGIEAVRKAKKALMKKVLGFLLDLYGVMPETFDFEYVDKDGKYHIEKGLTPLSFKEKYLGDRLLDFVSIINSPTEDKPYNKTYTVEYLGNVVGGRPILHLNVEMKRMKQLILSQLKDKQIVWFGSDVSFYSDRTKGGWDDGQYDYESAFGLDYKMDKGEALKSYASMMNHAMCITGVTLRAGKPMRWKIENSWGTDGGKSGYYLMSSSWFDRFVYQAVVDKKYLNEDELAALTKKPVSLKPWDPFGSLAD